ncbi:MAG: GspH/FimT family pseudopilin [Gammaproteobacteria bacterium]
MNTPTSQPPAYTPFHRENGVSLLELLVVLVIIAMSSSLALPALNNTLERNRVDAAKKTLVSTLALARNEALKRGHAVRVCASQDSSACSGNAADWGANLLVVASTDEDGKNIKATDPGAILLTTPLPTNITVSSNLANIDFRSDGSINQLARFTFCNTEAQTAVSTNTIAVNYAGRFLYESLDASQVCP